MTKAAFLFNEPEASGMDLSAPENGNPGAGGTALCFAYVIKGLDADSDIKVYAMQDTKLSCRNIMRVKDEAEAFADAEKNGYRVFILRGHQKPEVINELQKYDLKYIFWMHNRLTYEEICFFRSCEKVRRVLAVGREMYDFYIDDNVSDKLDYVTNPFVPSPEMKDIKLSGEKGICFVGSLIPDKNFHMLAEAWPQIKKEVPDARLHVIGNGKLYNRDAHLGPYGLAESEYEASFMKYLTDDEGKIDKDVVFHGIMGSEKTDVFRQCAVGVINPMGTETFGLAAVEMEACGLPVVSRMKLGLPDAVISGKTGILIRKPAELAGALILLLTDDAGRKKLSLNAVKFASEAFLPEKAVKGFKRVIGEVEEGKPAAYKKPVGNMGNNNKRVRRIFHGLHKAVKKLPSVHDIQKK